MEDTVTGKCVATGRDIKNKEGAVVLCEVVNDTLVPFAAISSDALAGVKTAKITVHRNDPDEDYEATAFRCLDTF